MAVSRYEIISQATFSVIRPSQSIYVWKMEKDKAKNPNLVTIEKVLTWTIYYNVMYLPIITNHPKM